MTTNGLTSWAVDLANIGAIYPFQGTETGMVIACVAFWIIWHIVQLNQEGADIRYDMQHKDRSDEINTAIDRY